MLKFIMLFLSLFFINNLNNKYYSWFFMMNSMFLMTPFFFMFLFNPKNIISSMSQYFSLDSTSIILIILTIWISALMMMSSIYLINFKSYKLFMKILMFLLLILFLSFSTNNLFLFYIFFETSLIPIFSMIMIWGYQPERMKASLYLILYTITASIPLLTFIFFLFKINFHINMYMYNWNFIYNSLSTLWWMMILLAFLVKIPMFLLHLWLPKAHVEAPVAGSMILASVLLKLGCYGIFRLTEMFQYMNKKIIHIMIPLSLMGGMLISFLCLRQTDLKSLIAYSSISHMALLLSGLISSLSWSKPGTIILMIAHGICSSSMFFLINILYSFTHTRSVFLTKGIMNMFPMFTFWWFTMNIINMGAPPFINLLSEIMLISSVLKFSFLLIIPLMTMMFFTASYSLYLFISSQHGNFMQMLNNFNSINISSYLNILMHFFPLILFTTKLNIFI
uniref:NADH-ubiquinone oxidoreductase chain 4 n=1 Tax=Siboglinum ekmani TaxID=167800 RepID=A0A0E3DR46_9ANNE|nr:NADH dehydrogenase subunit 4 [Siboglinum ekmani]